MESIVGAHGARLRYLDADAFVVEARRLGCTTLGQRQKLKAALLLPHAAPVAAASGDDARGASYDCQDGDMAGRSAATAGAGKSIDDLVFGISDDEEDAVDCEAETTIEALRRYAEEQAPGSTKREPGYYDFDPSLDMIDDIIDEDDTTSRLGKLRAEVAEKLEHLDEDALDSRLAELRKLPTPMGPP